MTGRGWGSGEIQFSFFSHRENRTYHSPSFWRAILRRGEREEVGGASTSVLLFIIGKTQHVWTRAWSVDASVSSTWCLLRVFGVWHRVTDSWRWTADPHLMLCFRRFCFSLCKYDSNIFYGYDVYCQSLTFLVIILLYLLIRHTWSFICTFLTRYLSSVV